MSVFNEICLELLSVLFLKPYTAPNNNNKPHTTNAILAISLLFSDCEIDDTTDVACASGIISVPTKSRFDST